MRLINAETYEVREFFDDWIPPYAILSHTWGEDEVVFEEMTNVALPAGKAVESQRQPLSANPVSLKEGFRKIRYACAQAKADYLHWVWVDTCCIDKRSSAELSEAINSMFRWYRLASKCYVYLKDFICEKSEFLGFSTIEEGFPARLRSCRWFYRAWTLQELIAPSSVIFFDTSWTRMGSRRRLAGVISEITSIPISLLSHIEPEYEPEYITRELDKYSVAQKMSWASGRRCTRSEDTAYSLLGLFDIHMPLLYGEGHAAFFRLQEEIFNVTDDHSILAWGLKDANDPDGYPSGVFAPSPSNFVDGGRVFVLHDELSSPSRVTKKGLEINLNSTDVKLNFSFEKFSTRPISFAVLNCGLDMGTSRMRVVLPLVPENENEYVMKLSPCYSRMVIRQQLLVHDKDLFRVSERYKPHFLRTHRHRLALNRVPRELTVRDLEPIEVELRLPLNGDSSSRHILINAVENLSYDRYGKTYRLGLNTWSVASSYFFVDETFFNALGDILLRARFGFQRTGQDRGYILLSLDDGCHAVRYFRYTNIEYARGPLATITLCVKGIDICLKMICLRQMSMYNITVPDWQKRWPVSFQFSFNEAKETGQEAVQDTIQLWVVRNLWPFKSN